jgi:hypothetical protein
MHLCHHKHLSPQTESGDATFTLPLQTTIESSFYEGKVRKMIPLQCFPFTFHSSLFLQFRSLPQDDKQQ